MSLHVWWERHKFSHKLFAESTRKVYMKTFRALSFRMDMGKYSGAPPFSTCRHLLALRLVFNICLPAAEMEFGTNCFLNTSPNVAVGIIYIL